NWLKLSLLYWDGLRRIVPTPVTPKDNPEVCQAVDAGFLQNTAPDEYRDKASEKFLALLEPLAGEIDPYYIEVSRGRASSGLDFIYHHNIGEYGEEFIRNPIVASKAWDIELLKKFVPVFSLHPTRGSAPFFEFLESHKLASKSGDSYSVDGFVGGLYMVCLAREMSENIGTSLVTDSPHVGAFGEYISFGKFSKPSTEEALGILLKLDIDFPTAESLGDVPISKIIKFCEQRKDERKRFRQAIESITTTGSEITDSNALADFLGQQREEIKSAIEDHRKVLDELSVKSVGSLLSVSAPTAVAAAAGLSIPPVAAVLTGVGVAVSLVQWWAEVRGNHREKTKGSPWHYLLSVKQFS
ncbi:MAG: hypothetical protein F6K28_43275, partial [Microcoleus sp. SIO2G3]|nr:hypothetical protein [Microcoleus sp. SIO2G3]